MALEVGRWRGGGSSGGRGRGLELDYVEFKEDYNMQRIKKFSF